VKVPWRFFGLVFCCHLAAAFASAQQDSARRPFSRPDRLELTKVETSVPLLYEGNHPVVEVKVNGKGPYRFILDTGASSTVISPALFRELRPPVLGEDRVGSPGGSAVRVKRINIAEIRIGDATLAGVTAHSYEYGELFTSGDKSRPAPRGLLSSGLFTELLVTFDHPSKRLVLRRGELPEPDGREVFAYDPREPLPKLGIDVAGMSAEVYVDSGAAWGLALPMKYAAELPLQDTPVVVGKGILVDREFKILAAKLKGTLKVGRYLVENPQLQFYETRTPVGSLGYEFLSNYAVTLDRQNGRIRLEEPGDGSRELKAVNALRAKGKSSSKAKKKARGR
jgi:Aspartyl protease